MKYLIVILGVILFLVLGCITSGIGDGILYDDLRTRYHDGCHYVQSSTGLTHKGNCPNPTHKAQ